jgi:uncharacterized protein YbjT (DUF2867 family)
MRIAITGGTGTVGREVALALYDRGHEVRMLARGGPIRVDLTDGTGLPEALAGVDAVIDAANGQKRELLVNGTANLLEAERHAGVGHHVAISIVGSDRAPGSYYKLKREQEAVVKAGGIPWSIVRATQFHPLVDAILSKAARFGIAPSPMALHPPLACASAPHPRPVRAARRRAHERDRVARHHHVRPLAGGMIRGRLTRGRRVRLIAAASAPRHPARRAAPLR